MQFNLHTVYLFLNQFRSVYQGTSTLLLTLNITIQQTKHYSWPYSTHHQPLFYSEQFYINHHRENILVLKLFLLLCFIILHKETQSHKLNDPVNSYPWYLQGSLLHYQIPYTFLAETCLHGDNSGQSCGADERIKLWSSIELATKVSPHLILYSTAPLTQHNNQNPHHN